MYRVHLQQFEGPLDLLLFFIRRDELDIYDIPIARIADEFLDYVRVLDQIDLDGVGDFLYMASVLVNIKTRMLLPSRDIDEEGEPIDPRQELVERLLEYVRFKEATEDLDVRFEKRAGQFTRGKASQPDYHGTAAEQPDWVEATVFDLISALRKVLTRAIDPAVHEIPLEEYSLEEQKLYLRRVLSGKDRVSFVDLMAGKTKSFIIATFLAILEMTKNQEISIFIASVPDDFFLDLDDDQAEA